MLPPREFQVVGVEQRHGEVLQRTLEHPRAKQRASGRVRARTEVAEARRADEDEVVDTVGRSQRGFGDDGAACRVPAERHAPDAEHIHHLEHVARVAFEIITLPSFV